VSQAPANHAAAPDSVPPYSPEAERGVLDCCLLDLSKAAAAVKAGVSRRWFYKHEEEDAFAVEMILRNLPPVKPFVVRWSHPLFGRDEKLDPSRLKQGGGGRPAKYTTEDLLEALGNDRLTTTEWEERCLEDSGVTHTCFFDLRKGLEKAKKIQKSAVDRKWEKIQEKSGNYVPYKDQ